MNTFIFLGNMVADPELKATTNNKTVCNFRVAVSRERDFKTCDFFECVAFEKTAENVAKYFRKGSRILIRGSVRNESWEDKSGNKRTTTKFYVDALDFPERKGSSDTVEDIKPNFEEVSVDDGLPF